MNTLEIIVGALAFVVICWALWEAGMLKRGAEQPPAKDPSADDAGDYNWIKSEPMPLDEFRKGGAL